MTLYETLTQAGVETDNHASDLYFPKTEDTTRILRTFPTAARTAEIFISQIDNRHWYDVPFAFDPYWTAREMKINKLFSFERLTSIPK